MSDFDNIRRVVQFDERRDGHEDRPSFSLSDVARLLGEYDRLRTELAKRGKQEPVAVVQPPDPFDDRDGPCFDQKELRVIKQLPAGTKLYTALPAAVPEGWRETLKEVAQDLKEVAQNEPALRYIKRTILQTRAEQVDELLQSAEPASLSENEIPESSLKTAIAILEGAANRNGGMYADNLKPVIDSLYEKFCPDWAKARLRSGEDDASR